MPFICSGGKDWQKSIIQKDILEFLGIFTINDQFILTINNSIQINIKFTFTVHESIIQFDIYIYIYIYTIYILYIYYIYTIYILYIYYIYINTYIYIYVNFVFFVYCNIVATQTYEGHTGFTFK